MAGNNILLLIPHTSYLWQDIQGLLPEIFTAHFLLCVLYPSLFTSHSSMLYFLCVRVDFFLPLTFILSPKGRGNGEGCIPFSVMGHDLTSSVVHRFDLSVFFFTSLPIYGVLIFILSFSNVCLYKIIQKIFQK